MYKKILIPVVLDTDRDIEQQFSVAKALSDETTDCTVLHVMEQIPRYIEVQLPEEIRANTLNEAKLELAQAAEKLAGASSVLLSGHAGRCIVGFAHDNGFDCIIVASHVPVVSDILLGSTASWIVRHSQCAVHVVR